MDDEDFNEAETYFHFTFTVSLTRFMGKMLLPSKLKVKLGLEIINDEGMELALRKVNHWIENHLTNCVAVASRNEVGFDALLNGAVPRLDNTIMITPNDPSDHHLMFILQSKIEAIADGAFVVPTVEIESNNAEGLTVTYIGDGSGELPGMEDWLEGQSWFTVPWWERDDISMVDTTAPEGTDLSVRPVWASTFDFLQDNQNTQPAVLIRGDFEPKIVGDDK